MHLAQDRVRKRPLQFFLESWVGGGEGVSDYTENNFPLRNIVVCLQKHKRGESGNEKTKPSQFIYNTCV